MTMVYISIKRSLDNGTSLLSNVTCLSLPFVIFSSSRMQNSYEIRSIVRDEDNEFHFDVTSTTYSISAHIIEY